VAGKGIKKDTKLLSTWQQSI